MGQRSTFYRIHIQENNLDDPNQSRPDIDE